MDRKSSVFAIRALGVLALIAVTLVPAVRSEDAYIPKFSGQLGADSLVSAPIIVAQGRCYNGQCY